MRQKPGEEPGNEARFSQKTAAFYTEQHMHQLITFLQHWSLTSGSNQLQKHGFICDAISSLVCMGTKQLLLKIAELETRTVCMEPQAGKVDSVVEQMPCQWQTTPLYISLGLGCIPNGFMSSSLPGFPAFYWSAIPTSHYILMLFDLVWNTKWTTTPVYTDRLDKAVRLP